MKKTEIRALLASLFHEAVNAANPLIGIRQHLPGPPIGKTVVIGAGKGAAQMAQTLEQLWPGPLSGTVVTRYGFGAETNWIRVLEAAHPVPDEAGFRAAQILKQEIRDLGPDDLVIALICGGGSALLPDPPEGMTLDDEIAVNKALLACGAPISVMNAVRKHLSNIKGGRLAYLTKARVISLVVSDIPGDNPALVSSGPTVPDCSTRQDALRFVSQYGIVLPQSALNHLQSDRADAPRPDDPQFAQNEVHIIASANRSLEAAAAAARRSGINAVILSDAIEGEACDVAKVHAAIAREIATRNRPFAKPVILLSGGETTVTLPSSHAGRGGRNSEFALSFAVAVAGLDVVCLAADTDGIDGSETNAGAFADGATASRLMTLGADPQAYLTSSDSFTAFQILGDLFITGPTGTNVNDFRCIVIF